MLVKRCREYDVMKCVDEDGNTPLHLACTHGYEEVALCLMKNNADIGARYYNNGGRGARTCVHKHPVHIISVHPRSCVIAL